jgi:hypothetical protein
MPKAFGLALMGVGVVLLVFGISAADSFGSDVSRFFSGKPTDKSMWLIVGGVAAILVGAGGTWFFRGRPNRT